MKTCEVCSGAGHICKRLCSACDGTGLISLGPESAARHAALVVHARERAAIYGWTEEVWEPVDPVACWPALARRVVRPVDPWLVEAGPR